MSVNNLDEENKEFSSNESLENNADATDEDILTKQEKENEVKELKQGYAFLGKCLWIYFFFIIPSLIVGVLQTFYEDFTDIIFLVGTIIGLVVSLASIVILIILGKHDRDYRIAGLLLIPLFIANLLPILLIFTMKEKIPEYYFSGICLIPNFFGLLGTRYEIKTHEYVTVDVDETLSSNWEHLWKGIVYCNVVAFCSMVFLLIVISFGEIMLFSSFFLYIILILLLIIERATLVSFIVIVVIKLIYLYRTAKLFQYLSIKD